jgi:hypothetical protein
MMSWVIIALQKAWRESSYKYLHTHTSKQKRMITVGLLRARRQVLHGGLQPPQHRQVGNRVQLRVRGRVGRRLRGQVGLGAVGAAVGDFLEQRGLRGRGADVLRRRRGRRRRRRAVSLFPVVFFSTTIFHG